MNPLRRLPSDIFIPSDCIPSPPFQIALLSSRSQFLSHPGQSGRPAYNASLGLYLHSLMHPVNAVISNDCRIDFTSTISYMHSPYLSRILKVQTILHLPQLPQ